MGLVQCNFEHHFVLFSCFFHFFLAFSHCCLLLNWIALFMLLVNALFFARGCSTTLLVAFSLYCRLFHCIVGWCFFCVANSCFFMLLVIIPSCCFLLFHVASYFVFSLFCFLTLFRCCHITLLVLFCCQVN